MAMDLLAIFLGKSEDAGLAQCHLDTYNDIGAEF